MELPGDGASSIAHAGDAFFGRGTDNLNADQVEDYDESESRLDREELIRKINMAKEQIAKH